MGNLFTAKFGPTSVHHVTVCSSYGSKEYTLINCVCVCTKLNVFRNGEWTNGLTLTLTKADCFGSSQDLGEIGLSIYLYVSMEFAF